MPNEEIGYLASEEYTSRTTSPRPPTSSLNRHRLSGSQTYAESPLRETSFPISSSSHQKAPKSAETAVESEDDVVHVDPPAHPRSKIHGGGYDPPTEDLGPQGGNTEELGGWIVEKGEGVPILASDEVAKNPEAEHMQPAVSPEQERNEGTYYAGVDSEGHPQYQSGWRNSSRPTSRPSSRPSSMHGAPPSLSRFTPHEEFEAGGTPLAEIEEYEPLFPEDEKDEKRKQGTLANKLKRPDLARHHFPSQDTWEDTPSSLQLETTVKSPQLPEEKPSGIHSQPTKVFEPPEAEQSRKEGLGPEDRASFLPAQTKQFAKSHFKPDVIQDLGSAGDRPGLHPRFPSEDLWEDSPSSMYLQTTVTSPQVKDDVVSPVDVTLSEQEKAKPAIPERPARSKAGAAVAAGKAEQRDVSSAERKPPSIPERPKPVVPARPAKHVAKANDSAVADTAPLTKTTSVGSDTSSTSATVPEKVNVAKIKPAPPARPSASSKMAAFKSGFMSDLQNKLSLGPQQVKKQEEEEKAAKEVEEQEKQPLSDARKGRARGPQRRKPAASPSAVAVTEAPGSKLSSALAPATTVWAIDDADGLLDVPSQTAVEVLTHTTVIPKAQAPFSEPTVSEAPSKALSDQPTSHSEKNDPLISHAAGTTTVAEPVTASSLTAALDPVPAAAPSPPRTVPSTLEGEDEPLAKEVVQQQQQDEMTQTGQTEIEISKGGEDPSVEKLTAFVGGMASEEGTVLVSRSGNEEDEGEGAGETA